MKITTWNVNSLNVRLGHVLDWLKNNPVDVLALQETKLSDDKFPVKSIEKAGYQVIFHGQKTYNGVAILSKEAAEDVIHAIPELDDDQARVISGTVKDVRIIDVYVPNGSDLDTPKYAYKLDWMEKLRDYVKKQIEEYPKLIVLGDYNVSPRPEDAYHPEDWEGGILTSDKERAALNALLELGLEDTWRLFPDRKDKRQRFTWWNYRRLGWRRNDGLRIDHILATKPLADSCKSCEVDLEPRKWDRPSDHAPVTAEFKI